LPVLAFIDLSDVSRVDRRQEISSEDGPLAWEKHFSYGSGR
jgi:hypothetical protein